LEVFAPDHDTSRAAPEGQLLLSDQLRGHPCQSRFDRQARHGRDLCRRARPRIRAAGGTRYPVRLRPAQRPSVAALRHRQAVRTEDERGRHRPELCLPDHLVGQRVPEREHEPVHGCGRTGPGSRRIQRRQLRSRAARLRRRRLYRAVDDRRPTDPAAARRPRGHAQMGRGLEKGDARELSEERLTRHARQRDELSRLVPRSRSDVSRRIRQSAAAVDLRFPRQRAQDVEVRDRQGSADRQGDEAAIDQGQLSRRPLFDPALRDDAQHRRCGDGQRSEDKCGQPLPAVLGRVQRLRDGRLGFPAKPRLQPDRYRRRAHLLGGGRAQDQVPQESRTAGSGLRRRNNIMRAIKLAFGLAGLLGLSLAVAVPARAQGTTYSTIERGRYLVNAGDCASCHTAEGGKPYAGGLAVPTPFGTIYSTNITPDPATGIGKWSEQDFYNAMHDGIRRDGKHLYPAFPYPWFTKVSRADVHAIKAFLDTVTPVRQQNKPTELPWPLSMREVMAGWNKLYFHEGAFKPDHKKSEQWNRGAYLVEGLGN